MLHGLLAQGAAMTVGDRRAHCTGHIARLAQQHFKQDISRDRPWQLQKQRHPRRLHIFDAIQIKATGLNHIDDRENRAATVARMKNPHFAVLKTALEKHLIERGAIKHRAGRRHHVH